MKRESYLLLWLILSIILAFILIATLSAFFYVVVFPGSRLIAPDDSIAGDIAIFIVFGLLILYLFSWTFRLTKKAFIAEATYRDATEHQNIVKAISKFTRGFGNLSLSGSQHIIAFEFSDRTRKTFEVDTIQYSVIIEGDTGLLTYKQNGDHFYFVAFEPF